MKTTYSLLKLLPEIFDTSDNSDFDKLWRIFSSEMREINQALEDIRLVYNALEQKGAMLDLIGDIVRQKRNGLNDEDFRLYLILAVQRTLSDGTIERIHDISRIILEENYIGIRELDPSQIGYFDWTNDEEYKVYLNNERFLDGTYFLSGDIFQPAAFEIRIKRATPDKIKEYFLEIIRLVKGAGILYFIKEID